MNLLKTILFKPYFLLKKIYYRLTNKKLKDEVSLLRYQIQYLKKHFDIENMKPATGWLREYQLKELDFAIELIEYFNKQSVFPFFDAGSLLGVVRHKGFVPWDDDIDLGVSREEFNKIIQIAKTSFVWINTNNITTDFLEFTDNAIKQNCNKYVVIQTPYCLHIYKGTSLKDSVNVEFFPFDYVKENVTDNEFILFTQEVKKNIDLSKPWERIFNYYSEQLENSNFFSKEKTSRITPGFGHYALTQYRFWGFRDTNDYLPLTKKEFENKMVPVPNNAEKFLSKNYSSWKDYPKDFGISHDLENLNVYLERINQTINYKEF